MKLFKSIRKKRKNAPSKAPPEPGGGKRGILGRLTVHPLFFLVGIASAFTGGRLTFLSACFAAIEHECAHAFAARRYGFHLDKIQLMPYGAVISGDISGMGATEEVMVALAGPLANLLTGLMFTALWWFFPDTYPFTEAAAAISYSLFFVNLLPAYPLDGGRILNVALRPFLKGKTKYVLRAVTLAVSAGILGGFVYSCFTTPNFSMLVFALLLCAGAFGGSKYTRLHFSRKKSFARGVEEKRIAISAACALKDGLRFLRDDRYLVFVLYDGEEFLGELSEGEYLSCLEKLDYSTPLGNCLAEVIKGVEKF